jgi:rhodanese-related sulfurtransferase
MGPDAVRDAPGAKEDVAILDVREPVEWKEGHIKGAKHLLRGLLETKAADELPDTDACLITHCVFGDRAHSPPKL